MIYFKYIKDLSALRKKYYQLAMLHHPDRGGDVEIMKLINAEYEKYSKMLVNGNVDFTKLRKVYENEVSEEIRVKINEVIHFDNLNIEVIGAWIWITGLTYPIKDKLKALSFKFSSNKTAWYWHSDNYIKIGTKQFSLEAIRRLWGSQEIEKDANKSLVLN